MNMKRIITLILFCGAFVAAGNARQERIILLNEGNWQADNGRITYFEDGKVISNKWFREVNGYKLGDTPNDIIQVNDNLIAIAVNWSNIVQFIRPDGTAVAATEDVPNNRKLATDGRYVFISSYGHECGTTSGMMEFEKGYVAKIDTETFKVVAAVEVGYEPEGIAYYDGHLFVANTGGYAFQEDHEYETTVSIIDAATMKLERNIDTGQINLYGKLSQSGQYLCINSPGDYYEVPACGIIFDCEAALSGSDECFVSIPYATTYSCATREGEFLAIGSRFSYNTYEYKFNYITINPHEVLITEGTSGITEELPGTMLTDISRMQSPYGIYVNPYTGYMYATDAGSYAAGGALFQWSPAGELLGQHDVYINPAHFLALPPDGNSIGETTDDENTFDGICYDLTGRRVLKPGRGLYIQNGKKRLVTQ
jgi:DNA-binding beta-propeller fold protein YncE